MHWLSILTLGIGANLDNLGVGLAYGVKGIRVAWASNALIAVMTGVPTLICGLFGQALLKVIPQTHGNILGGGIICGVGIWMVAGYCRDALLKRTAPPQDRSESGALSLAAVLGDPARADTDRSGTISLREAVVLGLALSLNAMAGGLGAGLTGVSVAGVAASVTVFSLLTIAGGVAVGRRWIASRVGGLSGFVAGLLLAAIGIYEMLM